MRDRFHVDAHEASLQVILKNLLFVAKNGPRSALRVYNFKKNLWRERVPVRQADAFYAPTECAHDVPMHVTCSSWLRH